MARSDQPERTVRGHICFTDGRQSDAYRFRARCYEAGHSILDVEGVTYYVPPEMTATQYLMMMFDRHPPLEQTGSGD